MPQSPPTQCPAETDPILSRLSLDSLRGQTFLSGAQLSTLLSARRALDLGLCPPQLRTHLTQLEQVRRASRLLNLLQAPRCPDLSEQGQARLSALRTLTRRLLGGSPERSPERGDPFSPQAWAGVAASFLHARVSVRLLELLREFPDVDAPTPEVALWIRSWSNAAGRQSDQLNWHLPHDLEALGFADAHSLKWMSAPEELHHDLREDQSADPARRVCAQLLVSGTLHNVAALAARAPLPGRWHGHPDTDQLSSRVGSRHWTAGSAARLLEDIWHLSPETPVNLTPRHLCGGLHFTMNRLALPRHVHATTSVGNTLMRLRALHHLASHPELLRRVVDTTDLNHGVRNDLNDVHTPLRDLPGPWTPTWQAVQTALETP